PPEPLPRSPRAAGPWPRDALRLALVSLVLSVLARDARRDLDAARVQVRLQLFLVLAAEPEPVGAHRGLLVADLLGHPGVVRALVLPPHLPLARVVLEHRLVDHRDALLDRA